VAGGAGKAEETAGEAREAGGDGRGQNNYGGRRGMRGRRGRSGSWDGRGIKEGGKKIIQVAVALIVKSTDNKSGSDFRFDFV
jgi:hypothetical protein